MSRHQIKWIFAALVLAVVVGFSAPAFPQDAPATAAGETKDSAVETILREQEEALTGTRFSYNPGDRRDPFRNIYDVKEADRDRDRLAGPVGMLITEMDLIGIAKDRVNGDVAMFVGSDNKGYFMRVGDKLYDGTIIGVDAESGVVTFRQKVDDPRRIKPYRDIEKRLEPLDNEGSGNE